MIAPAVDLLKVGSRRKYSLSRAISLCRGDSAEEGPPSAHLPPCRSLRRRPLIGTTAVAQAWRRELVFMVESRCGAVAVARTYLFPPLSSGGASLVRTWLRFHTPLIEPDMRIARIRLSDKTSRHRPRRAAPTTGQTYEPEVPVEVREWIRPASASPDLVFGPQPPAQPHRCVAVERAIGWG